MFSNIQWFLDSNIQLFNYSMFSNIQWFEYSIIQWLEYSMFSNIQLFEYSIIQCFRIFNYSNIQWFDYSMIRIFNDSTIQWFSRFSYSTLNIWMTSVPLTAHERPRGQPVINTPMWWSCDTMWLPDDNSSLSSCWNVWANVHHPCADHCYT